MSQTITLNVSGTDLPLLPTTAKSGNTYHALRKPTKGFNMAGLPIPALAKQLPDHVTIDGVDVELEDVLVTEYNGEVKVHDPGTKRRGRAKIKVAGEDRVFKITLSIRKDGLWNCVAVANRGAGGAPVAKPVDIAALWA